VFKWLTPKEELNDFDKELLSSNLLGAKNITELQEREKLISEIKTIEIKLSPLNGEFDYTHLKAIHR
jgi:cell filamentation protein